MSIVLDGTSGVTAPALDSDGSLTLGTAVMAVPTGDAPLFGCRAWVNFDGTKDTTGAASTANTNRLIRGSGNVASVLRNALGDYTVNFTTALPDANYAATISHRNAIGTGFEVTSERTYVTVTAYATTSVRVLTQETAAATGRDVLIMSLSIFR